MQSGPPGFDGLQQIKGANNIVVHKSPRPVDGPVHMRLCCKVHDSAWLEFDEQICHNRRISNVAVHKVMPGVALQRGQIL